MTPDLIKAFTTGYLASLGERTREEENGVKWGIDWIIYNLGLALYGKPVRLPFMRQGGGTTAKTKTEAEFGVDVSFLSADRQKLVIFVLKDEQLANKTWVKNGFYEDLCKAVTPDLEAAGLEAVTDVEVVLAYNRDETANGITLFENLAKSSPRTIGGRASLALSRWNLSELVDLSLRHLLTPSLLPQRFFGQMSYLCAQIADFPHGSDEWERQLVPSWKRFVDDVLSQENGVRGVSLVPVALIIFRQHGTANDSLETGWTDLVEWAAIALWRRFAESQDTSTKQAVVDFWNNFYLTELYRFYHGHIGALATAAAIDQIAMASMVGVAAASVVAYWHIGRLGLLSLGLLQSMPEETPDQIGRKREMLREVANWLVGVFNANESTRRPLLDIHHIEWVLVAFTLINANRKNDLEPLLSSLVQQLYLRRLGKTEIPFLDGRNSVEHVFEQIACQNEEALITSDSSYMVLVLLELACLLDDSARDRLLPMIHSRLVLAAIDGEPQGDSKPLDIMSWLPPSDWDEKVLRGYVDDGVAVSLHTLSAAAFDGGAGLFAELANIVEKMREAGSFPEQTKVPIAPLILASIRHRSPLPPEIWRKAAFPVPGKKD